MYRGKNPFYIAYQFKIIPKNAYFVNKIFYLLTFKILTDKMQLYILYIKVERMYFYAENKTYFLT